MGSKSSIEWTDATWNPIRGCSMAKGSEKGGCLNCYAARFNARNLPGMRSPTTGKPFAILRPSGPRWTGDVELIENLLDLPLRWKKPKRIFVNSQSDLFHEALSDEDIQAVFGVMSMCGQHTFQVLTKRPERMLAFFSNPINTISMCQADMTVRGVQTFSPGNRPRGDYRNINHHTWPLPNVWLGVSVENQATADARIPWLLRSPVGLRFVSYEPALGPVDFECWLYKLDWIIVGGESGPGARPFDVNWVDALIEQLSDPVDTLLFVKQLGLKPFEEEDCLFCGGEGCSRCHSGVANSPMFLKDPKGGNWDEWPEKYRIRQVPIIPSVADRMAEAGF